MKKLVTLSLAILLGSLAAHAQKAALKTNLLSVATATADIGAEVALSPWWTAEIALSYNPWTFAQNRKWKHAKGQGELRYWPCRKFDGWFLGLHAQGGTYNIGNVDIPWKVLGTDFSLLKYNRFEGWFAGAGIGTGYQWILSGRLNFELSLGAGYNYSRHDTFNCPECGSRIEEDVPHHYWGLTKAVTGLVYTF